VAEDNPVNMKLALQYLKRSHVRRIEHAANGLEAVKAMAKERFDVCFMDLYMPVADGFEACAKASDPRLVAPLNVPVFVAMTASVREQDRRRAAEVGMVEYVNKPAKREDFVKAMHVVRGQVEELARRRMAEIPSASHGDALQARSGKGERSTSSREAARSTDAANDCNGVA